MPNLQDSGYKLLFSNRTIFRQLIQTFVPQPWVKAADFGRAETVDKSFPSAHGRIEASDYSTLSQVYTNREEVQTMLIKTLERERQDIFEKGKREEKRDIARAMLAEGMDIEVIARVTGLPKEEIQALRVKSNPIHYPPSSYPSAGTSTKLKTEESMAIMSRTLSCTAM